MSGILVCECIFVHQNVNDFVHKFSKICIKFADSFGNHLTITNSFGSWQFGKRHLEKRLECINVSIIFHYLVNYVNASFLLISKILPYLLRRSSTSRGNRKMESCLPMPVDLLVLAIDNLGSFEKGNSNTLSKSTDSFLLFTSVSVG